MNPRLLSFFLLVLVTLFFNVAPSAVRENLDYLEDEQGSGAEQILDYPDAEESEEFENAFVENGGKDYKNKFSELVNFVNSMNTNITALKRENVLQRQEILELKQAVRSLHKIKSNLTWEDFDEFIRSIKTGNSFNGSTLAQIKSWTPHFNYTWSYTEIVFANHMDEAIQDFEIHDPYRYTRQPAPKSIPPHTQEIFTFGKSAVHVLQTCFSYFIPSAGVRIAAYFWEGVWDVGLAFSSKDTNMEIYYYNRKGIRGSWVYETEYGTDKNLSVSFRNFRARLFADHEGRSIATVRIELIKLPLLN